MISALEARAAAALEQVTIFDALTAVGATVPVNQTQQMRCPIHEDANPSARVYADENRVYCFKCAQRWNALDLVRLKFKLSFEGAIEFLERRFTLPPASANLTAVLRAQLRKDPQPDPEPAYLLAERELIRARKALGRERYGNLLLAIDLGKYRLKQGTLDYPGYRAILAKAMSLALEADEKKECVEC